MPSYQKPECYTDADWEMVQGYMRGRSGLPMERASAAYKHGWLNGQDDLKGIPRDCANVLIRRANMIPGITPMQEIGAPQ